jgi:hypothetical protein
MLAADWIIATWVGLLGRQIWDRGMDSVVRNDGRRCEHFSEIATQPEEEEELWDSRVPDSGRLMPLVTLYLLDFYSVVL